MTYTLRQREKSETLLKGASVRRGTVDGVIEWKTEINRNIAEEQRAKQCKAMYSNKHISLCFGSNIELCSS